MFEQTLAAETFCSLLPELPESGRWCELVRGDVVDLDPPSAEHGAVVLNLARALGVFCTSNLEDYACFDSCLVTRRSPDTVRRPSITYFADGPLFAENDAALSERAPWLVIEVLSSRARRTQVPAKLHEYDALGTQLVWLLDLEQAALRVHRVGGFDHVLERDATLRGEGALENFRCEVASLFELPHW